MISATDAVDLCCKAEKHRSYLQRQVERTQYMDKRDVEGADKLHLAYTNALDHFNVTFELED
jgi:hypothetical protein